MAGEIEEEDWISCPNWDGEEKSLPAGEQMRVPNMSAMNFVYRWLVMDPEEEEGYRLATRKELTADDLIVGARIN